MLFIITLYRAYANAVELTPESALFWHDLAVGYLYLGQVGSYHCSIQLVRCCHMTKSHAGKKER